MCLQLPRSAVGRVVARMAFRFGALRELLGMASPSPGLQLEVADFGVRRPRKAPGNRPTLPYVAPRCAPGRNVVCIDHSAFLRHSWHFQSFSTGPAAFRKGRELPG
jgi:hypothetical protein